MNTARHLEDERDYLLRGLDCHMSTSIVLLTPIVVGAAIAIMDMVTDRGLGLTLLVVAALGVSAGAFWSIQLAERQETVDAGPVCDDRNGGRNLPQGLRPVERTPNDSHRCARGSFLPKVKAESNTSRPSLKHPPTMAALQLRASKHQVPCSG